MRLKNFLGVVDLYGLTKSALSGILIGFGCIAYVAVENHIVGSFLFSLGLITVIIQKGLLYTGKIGYTENFKEIYEYLLPMLFVNLIAIWLTCFSFTGLSGINLDVSNIIEVKESETWYNALFRSIGCGAMMYIAVDGYNKTKNMLTVVLPVMFFILCGFDHCIANFGYMAMDGIVFLWQLPIWIVGNAIGSLLISNLD